MNAGETKTIESVEDILKLHPGSAARSGDAALVELPRYKCHKEVWALKIAGTILRLDGTMTITPDNNEYAPFSVGAKYIEKNDVVPGGYYVRYEDGYESFSPQAVFEDGYTLID